MSARRRRALHTGTGGVVSSEMGSRRSATSSPPPRIARPPASLQPRQPRVRSAAELAPTQVLEARDIRRKRPPFLSFLLRMSTLRRLGRIVSLLAIDFGGLAAAIFTSLLLKEAVRGNVDVHNAAHGTRQFLAFAYLLTALLFARSG